MQESLTDTVADFTVSDRVKYHCRGRSFRTKGRRLMALSVISFGTVNRTV